MIDEQVRRLTIRIAEQFRSVADDIANLRSLLSAASASGSQTVSIESVSGLVEQLDRFATKTSVVTSGLSMGTGKLLGRTSTGAGAVEEISVGTGLQLASGVLSSTITQNFPQTDFSQAIQSISAGNNIVIGTTYSMFEFSSGVDGTITGLDATSTVHGRLIGIGVRPGSAGILTIAHESASSTAAYRFRLNGVNLTLAAGDVALFQYTTDGAGIGRWRLVGASNLGVGGDIRSRLATIVVKAASQEFALEGVYSLTGLGANQNNLAVSTTVGQFATGSGGGGPYNITGLASTSGNGRILVISVRADMTTGVVLVHNSGLSTAGNRFFNHGAANVTILPGEARLYVYVGTGSAANNGWYQV